MNRKNNATYQMLTQVTGFAKEYVGSFPKTSAAGEILKALESGVQALSEEARTIVSAETAARVGRSARKEFRETLRTALVRASLIAEALNADVVLLPSTRRDQALIDSGHAFTVDAEPMKKEFLQHGLALEAVSAAVEALEQAILSCANAKAMRSAATQKWAAALDETLVAVKRYDPLVAITFEDNPGAMASYAVARAIPRSGGRKPAKPATEPVPPPATNAAAA